MIILALYHNFILILSSLIFLTFFSLKLLNLSNKFSLATVSFLIFVSLIWKYNSTFVLESPSVQSKAYLLYYQLGSMKHQISYFYPHSKKVFEHYEENSSKIYLRLLNTTQCLVFKWDIKSPNIELMKEQLGTYSMLSYPLKGDICPKKINNFELVSHKFNHVFEKINQSSSKHLYFF